MRFLLYNRVNNVERCQAILLNWWSYKAEGNSNVFGSCVNSFLLSFFRDLILKNGVV